MWERVFSYVDCNFNLSDRFTYIDWHTPDSIPGGTFPVHFRIYIPSFRLNPTNPMLSEFDILQIKFQIEFVISNSEIRDNDFFDLL